MTTKPQDLQEDEPGARGAQLVQRLFDHLGVPKRERTKRVEELMGWTYHPAHRRVTGGIPWTVDELERLTELCGMSLLSLLQLERQEEGEAGTLVLGSLRLPCRVWVDGPSDPERPSSIVAVKEPVGNWLVLPTAEAGAAPSHSVKTVTLQPGASGPPYRVAVVDDSPDITDSVCAYLRLVGFDAQPYSNFEQLSTAIKDQPHDAYIIDWLVASTTAAALFAEIRTMDPLCPIVMLTGKVRDGKADPAEVAAVIARHGADFFEKPAVTPVIAARLRQALDSLNRSRPVVRPEQRRM
jgi:CheY-like chemotaxis protein